MKAHDLDGNEFDIDRAEAERIAGELAKLGGHETNEAFMERAAENIKMATGMKPKTEDEAKEILYRMIPGWTKQHVEAVFETMEWIAGMHKQKVG